MFAVFPVYSTEKSPQAFRLLEISRSVDKEAQFTVLVKSKASCLFNRAWAARSPVLLRMREEVEICKY